MNKKTVLIQPTPPGLASLVAEVRSLIRSARAGVAASVNVLQVRTNFEIGRRIVEQEQKGSKRAAYGTALLQALSVRLTGEFGPGFSLKNLENMRKFYRLWMARLSGNPQTPSAESPVTGNVRAVSGPKVPNRKSQTLSATLRNLPPLELVPLR